MQKICKNLKKDVFICIDISIINYILCVSKNQHYITCVLLIG